MGNPIQDWHAGFLAESGNSSIETLDNLCTAAAQLLGMTAAALTIKQNKLGRIIAGHGMSVAMRAFEFDFAKAPYRPEEEFVLADARGDFFAERLVREMGFVKAGAMIRMPIDINDQYILSIFLFRDEPVANISAKKIKVLKEIGVLIKSEYSGLFVLLADPMNDVTIPKSLTYIREMVRSYPGAAFLLDDQLAIIETNENSAALTEIPVRQLIGMTHQSLLPHTADAVHFLYRRALTTRLSPPDFEIILESRMGPRAIRLNVTPFCPTDSRSYFLFVVATETTETMRRESHIVSMVEKLAPIDLPKEPSSVFLLDTLVRKRSIRQRKSTNYLVLRAWRQSIKSYQISALKALKQNIPHEFSDAIATEFLSEINALFGWTSFRAIVPMPCGHSRGPTCLSVEIARALGFKTGLPVIQAFISEPVKGVSHPKENAKRPPLRLVRTIEDPVLLVDDVATSGAHMEEAVGLLKPTCGSVLPVAWIGGESAESDQVLI